MPATASVAQDARRMWNLNKIPEDLKTALEIIKPGYINAQRDPFVLKFPPEISSHIFLLSTDTESDDELPMPFVLGSVCCGWRGQHRNFGQRSPLGLENPLGSRKASLNSKPSVTGCSYLATYR